MLRGAAHAVRLISAAAFVCYQQAGNKHALELLASNYNALGLIEIEFEVQIRSVDVWMFLQPRL